MNGYKDLADSLNNDKEYIPRARRIFNNLNAIEAILYTGMTFNSVATILSNNGFEITFQQLKTDIYRARKITALIEGYEEKSMDACHEN